MMYVSCIVTLMIWVYLGHGEFTDGKANPSDVVQALMQQMTDFEEHQRMELSEKVKFIQQEMKQKNEHMEDEIIQLEDHTKRLKEKVRRRFVSDVMFSAYLSTEYDYSTLGSVIPFDQVDVNTGDNFNTTTHTFVCPENGLYFFTYSLQSGILGGAGYRYMSGGTLEINGKVVSTARSRNFDDEVGNYVYSQSSASVITSCVADGEVMVVATDSNATIYGGSTLKETTFAGFLLESV